MSAGCARHSGDIATVTNTNSSPAFETRIEIDTGSDTHADYCVADFTGDGVLDMAVISLTGELRVLVGNGASFVESQALQIGGIPIWMAAADFDGDGDQDLVIVRSNADETGLWRNDGSGGFSMAGTLNVGTDALAVSVGDLNGDGIPDVAVSRPSTPEIIVGYSDGQLGFASQQQLTLPGGGTAFNLVIGDANRDNSNDLVVADTGFSRLVIYEGTSSTGLGADLCELSVAGTPGAVTFGDMNGDGLDDMVVSAFTANRFVVITEIFESNPLTGGVGIPVCTFSSFDIDVPAQPTLAKVGDVTGDGINDLVACLGFSASICVATGVADNAIGDLVLFDSTGLPLRPFIGRFDDNNSNDVFALSGNGNRVNLWLGRDAGPLAGARNYASGLLSASWLEGADFDLDGDFEVVTGSKAESDLAIMGGNGELSLEETIDVGENVYQIKAADLDLDGLVDLVVGVSGGIKILRNTSTPGSYSFEVLPVSPTTIGSGSYPFGIEVGDFDSDGDQDITICDYVGGGVHLVLGTPTPFAYEPDIIINVGGGPVDIVAADFTGDGLQDFAVSRDHQSDIAILRNDGNNQYVESMAVPVGQSPKYLVTSDFNNDGRADLVVSNAVSGSVSVLFGTENGFTGNDFAAGLSPTALLARDLTGDGIVDILVASLVSGDFRVLVGDGQGGFPLLPSFAGTLGASDAVLQDMDGDGLPELLVSSLITDRVSLVRNIRQ